MSWATACYGSAYGVSAAQDIGGCSTGYTLAGEFQRLIDTYTFTLISARDRAAAGLDPGFGGGTSFPWQILQTLQSTASYYCATYPGACPADPSSIVAQYSQILTDVVAQYGFDMNGHYSAAMDNQPGVDSLYPDGITETPTSDPTSNAVYSPSAGWRPPIDSIPPAVVPTIPAYTSPSNVEATSPSTAATQANPLASGGGSTVAQTASGSGSSVGGSVTQQSTMVPAPGAAAAIAALGPDAAQKKLLMILAVIAVVVFLFRKG